MEGLNGAAITVLLFIFTIQYYYFKNSKNNKRSSNQPPSPLSLPIIGHLYLIKQPFHHTIHNIATKYGEVLHLRIAVRNMLLISSPADVEECRNKNDTIFADRPDTLVGRICHYDSTSIAFSPYNSHFRTLKKVLTQEFFSSTKTPLIACIRQEEVRLLLKAMWQDTSSSTSNNTPVKVHMQPGFSELILNLMTKMVPDKRFYGRDVGDTTEAKLFSSIIKDGTVLQGSGNPGEILPMLKFLFRGLEMRMVTWMDKTDRFCQRIVDERKEMNMAAKDGQDKPIVDVLISL